MTDVERAAALEAIAEEIRACTRCRLHETRTRAVPGEGSPETEVVFVGEGPGYNEDREGRPFVGRAGALLERLLASVGWRRRDVFITNIVKCRPPDNRDPEPEEIAACAPYLRRQLEALDPALVVTLGRHSMGRFLPGARISGVHGTARPADPATGAGNALVFAMYHPAAALRTPDIERQSFEDMAAVPATLLAGRERRERNAAAVSPRDGAPIDAASSAGAATAAPPAPASWAAPPPASASVMAVPGPDVHVQPPIPPTPADVVATLEPPALQIGAAAPSEQPADGSSADQLTLF